MKIKLKLTLSIIGPGSVRVIIPKVILSHTNPYLCVFYDLSEIRESN